MKDFISVRCFCCFNGEVDVVDHDLWSTMDVCPKMFLSWTSNKIKQKAFETPQPVFFLGQVVVCIRNSF